ncbi:unnamed protein product [Malus baccata var. baccata]
MFICLYAMVSSSAMAKPPFASRLHLVWVFCIAIISSLAVSTSFAELQRLEHAAKRDDGSLSFLVVGDWGRRGLYNQSKQLDIDFVVSTGDNFYGDGLKNVNDPAFLESFKNIYTAKSLQKQWYSVLGNHDYRGNIEAQLSPALRKIDSRWFCQRSFIVNAGIAEFFFVDTTPFVNKYLVDKDHNYDWRGVSPRATYLSDLLQDLKQALNKSSAKWKIVVGHHAIRSAGHHGDTPELISLLLPMLKAYNVDMYMNGHDHCLEHISSVDNPIQYLTSGAGSKAWRGDIKRYNNRAMKFYHDGQGFMSVKLAGSDAEIAFYDVLGRLQRFPHAVKADGSLRFLVLGDWGRRGDYNQSQVADQMGIVGEKLDIDFVISTGDNFYDNGLTGIDDPQFEDSFSKIYTAPSLQKQWYSVLGNHDYRGDVEAQLSPVLGELDSKWLCLRSFMVDAEIVEFFFVDTTPFVDKYFTHPEESVYDWSGILPRNDYLSNLLKDVDSALKDSTAKWRIVVGHHTIRTAGYHGETKELVTQLLPILLENNVDLYINGHDHCLEHISSPDSPLQFLTSGGGSKAWRGEVSPYSPSEMKLYYDGQGFMSVQITQTELDIAFYDVFGNVLHKWGTSKQQYSFM